MSRHIGSVPRLLESAIRGGLLVAALVMTLVMAGCAYKAGYGDRQLPGGYRTIAVPVFKNKTHDAGIETYFTNAMVRELERMRIGRVTSKSDAQVTLLGTVGGVEYTPGNTVVGPESGVPSNAKLNLQYRINLTVAMKLVRNADDRVLWEGSFSREQTYSTPQIGTPELTSANALYNHSARYQNIEVMAADLMAEAHDRLTENF